MDMEIHFLSSIFAFFCLALIGSNASLPADLYWQSMLPNTPMPKVIQDLLKPGKKSSFSELEIHAGNDETARASYKIGYWSEAKQFEKNEIFTTTTIYFLYDDLVPGKKMNIIFSKSSTSSNFLPRKITKTIPFSSKKLPEIFKYFSIKPKSKVAKIMKRTIEECEAPGIRGEDKYCATSLESLVEFIVAKFGKKVEAFSNDAKEDKKNQKYIILKGIKMMGDNQIVCHKEIYTYAVFYCHKIMNTKVYMVPLMGDDSSKAQALVVCHLDASSWNPKHFAFQVLNVKPGGRPVCHFLNSDTIVWVPK